MHPPIIKLEIQQMKHTAMLMLSEQTAMLDEQVKLALESALKPENIEGVIRATVRECVNAAVKEEIQSFFRYSKPGRVAIREAVQEFMCEQFGDRD